jgi:hypothetical protein
MTNIRRLRTMKNRRQPTAASRTARQRLGLHGKRLVLECLEDRRLLSLAAGPALSGVSPAAFWSKIDSVSTASTTARDHIAASAFQPLALNADALRAAISAAPMEFSLEAARNQVEIPIPKPDGSFSYFTIVESPIMAPALAAQFPEITTYAGCGIDDPAATIRCDVTPAGFHAQVLSPSGDYYVDPYWHLDDSIYASYYEDATVANADTAPILEGRTDDVLTPDSGPVNTLTGDPPILEGSSGTQLRTYRLAVAATGEYTQYHGGTVALGQAAIVTAVNRVTGIYEKELTIRMQLVANNSALVYTNSATDPYTNDDANALLYENQANIDSVIGTSNYDIGHVFSTGGGGLAYLGVVGDRWYKAQGETGMAAPTGDAFYVDYVAHEMGHQFGANHTFNGTRGAAAGNRDAAAAMEPGSGSTIMGYAGICGLDDLQAHSDDYFHSISFDEIMAYVDGDIPSVGTRTSTGNVAPTIEAGVNYTIPAGTPFTLTATGSDPNGDTLTYCWEERDLGSAQALSHTDNGSSPIFRSWLPTTSPSRTFPRLSNLLANTLAPGETLPATNRTLHFRVTARDNRTGGGGVNNDDMQVTVVNSGTGFSVTSPNTAVTWAGGTTQTVAWNVSGTTSSPISTANVNILLSTDGGNTFSITLVANTPNDGSQTVTVPNVASNAVRVRVEAVGNIFFDVSNANATIVADTSPPKVTDFTSSTTTQADGLVHASFTATFSESVQISAANVVLLNAQGQPMPTATFNYDSATHQLTVTADDLPPFAEYTLRLLDTITDSAINPLDGEFDGHTFPSGNGTPGGNFDWTFYAAADTIYGTAGDDTMVIIRDAADASLAEVFVNNSTSTPTYSVRLSSLTQLHIAGSDGDDQLSVDFSRGNPLPVSGIVYDGGAHTTGDTLRVKGTAGNDSLSLTDTSVALAGMPAIAYLETEYFAFDLDAGENTFTLDQATWNLHEDNALSAATHVVVDGGTLDDQGHTITAHDLTVRNDGTATLTMLSNMATTVESGTLTASSAVSDALIIGLSTAAAKSLAPVPRSIGIPMSAEQDVATPVPVATAETKKIESVERRAQTADTLKTPAVVIVARVAERPTASKTADQPVAANSSATVVVPAVSAMSPVLSPIAAQPTLVVQPSRLPATRVTLVPQYTAGDTSASQTPQPLASALSTAIIHRLALQSLLRDAPLSAQIESLDSLLLVSERFGIQTELHAKALVDFRRGFEIDS